MKGILMGKTELYDVIIVGAGPAGLAVGSELSRRHKVLLIDKGQAGKTLKSWFVPLDVVDEKVMPFTYNGVTRFMTKTFGGANVSWKAELFDRYPYINEKTLLPHWLDVMRENGAEVIDHCAYIDSSVNEGIVTVETTSGLFRCRLLIDASGSDSPIVKKYGIDRCHYYWWSVFGCIGEHPNGLNGMEVGDYMLWQTFRDSNADPDASMASGRPVFEYEILDEKTSFSFVFFLGKERVPREVMEKEYMTVIRNEPTTADFHDLKIRELKYGWYPSGALSQQLSEDYVVFIGDAGCWTTPCGWGMTFVLRNYRHFADGVSSLLLENRLDKKSLNSVAHYKTHEKFEVLLDAIVTHFLSNATAGQLDRFINLFSKIPKILCEKVFTLTITRSEVHVMLKAMLAEFELMELARILTKEDFLLVLEEIKYFAEDTLVQKMHEVFSLFHNGKPGSYMNDGFDLG
jgi:flavin-dependent dehydrogenase